MQSSKFLGRLLEPLMKAELPSMKDVLMPLAKNVLITLGFTTANSASDAKIHKKYYCLGFLDQKQQH